MGCRKLTYYPDTELKTVNEKKELTLKISSQKSCSVYLFGFNGQEKDDEVAGAGNTNTAMFWEYDTRLGRRWNLDPKPQINISDYSVMGNNPITNMDWLGDNFDGYTVSNKGEIKRVDEIKRFDEKGREYDMLYTESEYKRMGDKSTNTEKIYDTSILKNLSTIDKRYEVKTVLTDAETGSETVLKENAVQRKSVSNDRFEMIKTFRFLAINSSVEWRLHYESSNSNYILSTRQLKSSSPDDFNLKTLPKNVTWMIHSHGKTPKNAELVGMHDDNEASKKYNRFFVYFPLSGNIYSLYVIGTTLYRTVYESDGSINSIDEILKK